MSLYVQEIVAALHGGCRIIPITDEAFLWPDEDSLPLDIRAVTRYQSIPSVLNHTIMILLSLQSRLRLEFQLINQNIFSRLLVN